VLGFENLRARLGMLPVEEPMAIGKLVLVVPSLDLLDLQPLVPGKEQRDLGAAVVLDVALSANERPHLLAGGIGVGIVSSTAASRPPSLDARDVRHGLVPVGERLNPSDEPRPRDAQLHGPRIVAIDAAHRMRAFLVLELRLRPGDRVRRAGLHHFGMRVGVGHLAERFESLEDVAVA
jgi:hypothetical protein